MLSWGQLAGLFALAELAQELVGADLVGNGERIVGIAHAGVACQRRHAGAGAHRRLPFALLVELPIVAPFQLVVFIHVFDRLGGRVPFARQHEFAEDAKVDGLGSVLPEEAGGRNGESVGHIPGVAARGAGKGALHVIADEALHQPLVAVEADGAAGVEVVERHVAFGQGVVIGGDVAAVHGELGVAIAAAEVAEHLVVGAVFLDDEEDVLDAQRGKVARLRRRGRDCGVLAARTSRVPAITCIGRGAGILLERAFVLLAS